MLLSGVVVAPDKDGAPGETPDGCEDNDSNDCDCDAHNDTGKLRWVIADSS